VSGRKKPAGKAKTAGSSLLHDARGGNRKSWGGAAVQGPRGTWEKEVCETGKTMSRGNPDQELPSPPAPQQKGCILIGVAQQLKNKRETNDEPGDWVDFLNQRVNGKSNERNHVYKNEADTKQNLDSSTTSLQGNKKSTYCGSRLAGENKADRFENPRWGAKGDSVQRGSKSRGKTRTTELPCVTCEQPEKTI